MTETAWQAAESAAAVLGPEADVLADVDGAGLGQAALTALWRAAQRRCRAADGGVEPSHLPR